jgi:drug/metabolite transporter (DMT)-like permease
VIYLALSILSSVTIFVIFKLFSRYQINTLHAIVINYIVACSSGIIAYEGPINFSKIPSYDWFFYTLGLGALFIIVFNLMAITTQRSGLSVVSVATKMSVVIPIIFGLVYYKESFGVYKIIGVLLALIAVYLASIKKRDGLTISTKSFVLPLLVFIGSGIIDTSIKFLENSFVAENDVPIFSATIFGSAALLGLIILGFKAVQGNFTFQVKNVLGGIALGIPNYFSIFFLVKALRSDLLDSSGIFTVNNVAIVMISTLFGIILFKESLSSKNWIGILLAIVSIFLVTLSGF